MPLLEEKKTALKFSMVTTIIHKHRTHTQNGITRYFLSYIHLSLLRIGSFSIFLHRLHSIALLLFPILSDTFKLHTQ